MTTVEALKLAGNLIDRGDLEHSEDILTKMPPLNNGALEVERWFLLGQISSKRGDYDTAIKIYKKILDDQPTLARIRFELATCYMETKQWYRADYHLRLAMTDDTLPDNAKKIMGYLRYVVRQNKNWNVWFNFGAAPDNNINQSVGGEECVDTIFGTLCRQLPEPEKVFGFNFSIGGDYEFKLSDNHWRWKTAASVYTNTYNKHKYDDVYVGLQSGPRYVYNRGSVWLAGTANRRYYGHNPYGYGTGGMLAADYDFTNRLSGGASVSYTTNIYDDYGEFMDGDTTSGNLSLSYSFDASKYLIWRGGLARENTIVDTYANWRKSLALGFGAELWLGFNAYLETSVYWTDYDGSRWVVKDGAFSEVAESSFTQRHSVSLGNNNVAIWGFVPTLTYSYTDRDSNIWQREYSKHAIEFTLRQKF